MELPEQFKQFNYLIAIIRHFIFADYLKTKQEQLRWYARNTLTYSPYKCVYGLGGNITSFLGYKYDNYTDGNVSYSIKNCTKRENGVDIILTDQDIFDLLNTVKVNDIEDILKGTINPAHEDVRKLIEKEYNKKIFPIDKSALLEEASAKFILNFSSLFNNINLHSYQVKSEISADLILITNQINDYSFAIPKHLFIMYCDFNTLIKNCDDDDIDTITTPFVFNEIAGSFLTQCLLMGKIQNLIMMKEEDITEFKQLMSFLQIGLNDKPVVIKQKIIKPF